MDKRRDRQKDLEAVSPFQGARARVGQLIREDPQLSVIYRLLVEQGPRDGAHDSSHAMRVAEWAIRLAPAGHLEPPVVVAAALLHDLIQPTDCQPFRDESAGPSAEVAEKLLYEAGFSPAQVMAIIAAVREHSYSVGLRPSGVLSSILQDADRLDALGAIGVLRVATTGERMGASYYDWDDPWAHRRALDDSLFTIDHFFTKLRRLSNVLHTAAAKLEAHRRVRFMDHFLKELGRELGEEFIAGDTAQGPNSKVLDRLPLPDNPLNDSQRWEVRMTAPGQVSVQRFAQAPLAPTQVRVSTVLSGISHGTELSLFRGESRGFHRRWDSELRVFDDSAGSKRYPIETGYECVGRVEEVGCEITDVRLGDLVWLDRPHRSEHVVTAAEALAGLLPEGITARQAVFLALGRVALGAIHDAHIKVGDNVAIFGLGTIGQILVQLARLSGAAKVFAVDFSSKRRSAASRFGGIPIEAGADAGRAIKACIGGTGVDIAIEASGSYQGLHTAVAACGINGTVVVVSSYTGEASGLRLGDEFHRNGIRMISSMTVNGVPHADAPRWTLDRLNTVTRDLLRFRTIDVMPLLTHTFHITEAARAYQLIADSEDCIRVAFRYD
jgi:2-desacetyl-2-hydroxyethyl bacteriochlorophyllide A dehydrogenase